MDFSWIKFEILNSRIELLFCALPYRFPFVLPVEFPQILNIVYWSNISHKMSITFLLFHAMRVSSFFSFSRRKNRLLILCWKDENWKNLVRKAARYGIINHGIHSISSSYIIDNICSDVLIVDHPPKWFLFCHWKLFPLG